MGIAFILLHLAPLPARLRVPGSKETACPNRPPNPPMLSSCSAKAMIRGITPVLALAAVTSAQTLVEGTRADEVRAAFERSATTGLRCDISPVKPALTYGFRFQTGYNLSFPLAQFRGAGHQLDVHVRVTPEGRPPLYLTERKNLPEVPGTKADGVADGAFIVGEGAYSVDLLAVDEERRSCRGSWQIQARRSGTERSLTIPTPPGTVADANTSDPPAAERPRDIGRVTILLHAAPLSVRRGKLDATDVSTLTGTLSTLLRQWPARSVHLIAFNIDQRAVIEQSDSFDATHIDSLADKLEQVQNLSVDYK